MFIIYSTTYPEKAVLGAADGEGLTEGLGLGEMYTVDGGLYAGDS